jgi:hypothetical protein
MPQPRTLLCLAVLFTSPAAPLRSQGFSPEQALRRMQVPDGFQVQLVASEPAIRQPLTMTFDGRGRLWVVQYLQYPTPAGLTPIQVDQYLRTTYDRVPEPPPHGPKGADRITILEDPDEHGRYRKAHDFVTGLITFGIGSSPVGAVELSTSIYPNKAVTDVLVFEVPLQNAAYLDLELPAQNYGTEGMVRFRIPMQSVRQAAAQ